MSNEIKKKPYFTKAELCLWGGSVLIIVLSFFIFSADSIITLVASIIGATALIFNAKDNPIGLIFMITFCIFYGIISYSFRYYGEMITYLGMSAPMAIISLIAWLKNPHNGNRSEVQINQINKKDIVSIAILTFCVTLTLYFILKFFGTNNLLFSTLSVATSFTAVNLTYRRSPYYAIWYAINDIVLIVLWILATIEDISYLSVIICFIMFLLNDTYAFINWKRMHARQQSENEKT